MLEDIFAVVPGGVVAVNYQHVVINLVLAFALSLAIALVYKATHKGLSYSQSFVMTLVMSGIVTAAIMMVIGSNIAFAFGAFGAFSLIRFRTAIKDARDMGYMFLVLAVGMGVGTNNYTIAVVTTIIALLVMYILSRINFGAIRRFDFILSFSIDTRVNNDNTYKDVFAKYLKSSGILNIKSREQGHVLSLSFSVKFISESDTAACIEALERLEGISDVQLISAKNDVEY